MPKTITINLTNQQYQALVDLVDNAVAAPGTPSAATVEEYCARMFARTVLRPAIEQFPPAELRVLRRAREKALRDYEEAAEPTVTASISTT